ncbi:zinc finger protein 592 isoform X2 [Salminus brasiliensis]|uniref:zinc finger protein 592 isoform X2 n=1 Tax=Salminus brasiliensis TaxID=930266 RepID=UPI003B8379CD
MGDMKTPDFDDLLAAFDIPDATSLDAKEVVQESQDDAEGHLKHPELCMDTTVSVPHPVTALDAPAVSVIVKNTNLQDSFEPLIEKKSSQFLLLNGFKNSSCSLETHLAGHSDYTVLDTSSLNGNCSCSFLGKNPVVYNTEKGPPLSKSNFSPVSNSESEDILSNGINSHGDSYFPNDSLFMSLDTSMSDSHGNSQAYCLIDKSHKKEPGCKIVDSSSSVPDMFQMGGGRSEFIKNLLEKTCGPVDDCTDDTGTSAYPSPETNPSCPRTCVTTQTFLAVAHKENTKVSPKVPISPRGPRSPLEVVKRLMKQPDSPMSICIDSSGKALPAVAAGPPLAIPRVRIKTIKTSSGQMKRTVTSIFPDSEPEDLHSPFGSSPSQSSVEDAFSRMLSVCHSSDTVNEVIFENEKQGSTPPSGCASANVESLKSSKKSPNSTFRLKRSQKASKQRKVSLAQVRCSANPNYLPKALHLANLNLVPHSVAVSVTVRSSTHRQDQSQLISPTVCSSVPLVHQVKKSSPKTCGVIHSSAAGTLNRLLNYTNPVPTYVPNLTPPSDSDIKLPAHGYCCLECGDSFGLEKSLAFHYSRRSVHIEVTCTHCSKTLVFFNRCALLAHARDHKNKGMMMQCSQLFMKPIPVNEMSMPSKLDSQHEQSASQMTLGRGLVRSFRNHNAVPLYPDKIVQPLKCLECGSQMLDYIALAGHYQRSSTESEGLMCKVCTMLLPNKCSYRAHQRIHTQKSPFCCPECGALSHAVDFQKHVKENCLHYARKVGYSCLHCETFFMSLPLLKSHIEEKHCEVFYKCTICPVAFKSSDGCLMHVKSKHGGSEPLYQLIHKCSCETVFKKKHLLYQHLHQQTCIFRCPECTLFFIQKIALVQHFKRFHGGVFRGEQCPKFETESGSNKLNNASTNQRAKQTKTSNMAVREARNCSSSHKPSSLKNIDWNCGECALWMPDRETFFCHMKTSHGKVLHK